MSNYCVVIEHNNTSSSRYARTTKITKPQESFPMQSTNVETPSHNERDYEIFSGRGFFGDNPNAIDQCLKFLPGGLILDLGAAIGSKSQIYRRMSPDSRVFAFEPYPGNWPHFEKK